MSRTIAQIKAAMVTAKATYTSLAALTSTSATAIWSNIFDVVSASIKIHEDLWDIAKDEMESRVQEIPTGTLKWYAAESLLFQYGYNLEYNRTTKLIEYTVLDEDAQIVELSAATVSGNLVIIKAAKLTAGVAEKLSVAELAAFTQYWTEKRFAGTSIQIISTDPDLLKCYLTVKYNPLLLDNTGVLLSDGVTKPVEVAINDFLQQYQEENFNGDMQVMKLIDAVQNATGVLNVYATAIEAKKDGGSYTDVLAATAQTYSSYAGYMKIDPSFPLSGTITYQT